MIEIPQFSRPLFGPNSRIAFYGPMASGKSHCAQYLIDKHKYHRASFAAPLKNLAEKWFGVTSKDGEGRKILQQLGQKMREIDENVWVKQALLTMPLEYVVFDDLRYLNEAVALKNAHFTLIRVDVPEDIRLGRIKYLYPNTPIKSFDHSSEQEWKYIEPDYVVNSYDFYAEAEIEKILGKNFQSFSESLVTQVSEE